MIPRQRRPDPYEVPVVAAPVTPRQTPVVQERLVVQPAAPLVAVTPAASQRVVTTRRIDPASVLAVVVAVALGVVGAVAVARAGLEGPMDDPIVEVAGFTHTAILGFVEIGMAVVLVWAGLSRDRGALLFVSILFGAASLVAAIEPSVGGDALAIEQAWAVLLVFVFALIALTAALSPTLWRSTRVERI